MNLYAALTLSTRQQAYTSIKEVVSMLTTREKYRLVVSDDNTGDNVLPEPYKLDIFHVTYPDAAPGKGWGEPKRASEAHFSKSFSEEELLKFFEKNEFPVCSDWQPLENE